MLEKNPHDAWAHDHLGLVLEQLGDQNGADRELGRARSEAPGDFKPPIELPTAEFEKLVKDDLTAEEAPLAPTILGLE